MAREAEMDADVTFTVQQKGAVDGTTVRDKFNAAEAARNGTDPTSKNERLMAGIYPTQSERQSDIHSDIQLHRQSPTIA
jgi:hypothetical protein